MKLPQFTTTSGTKISVNPQHVVTVRVNGDDMNQTTIFLVTGGQIIVKCSYDEVMAKLSGETPWAGEPQ